MQLFRVINLLVYLLYTDIRELSEERELLDDSIGESRRLSRKLGRIERTLDRMDDEKHKVSH